MGQKTGGRRNHRQTLSSFRAQPRRVDERGRIAWLPATATSPATGLRDVGALLGRSSTYLSGEGVEDAGRAPLSSTGEEHLDGDPSRADKSNLAEVQDEIETSPLDELDDPNSLLDQLEILREAQSMIWEQR
jgi:hypothetical protein